MKQLAHVVACVALIALPGISHLCQAGEPKEKATLKAPSGSVKCVAVSPDGKTLALGNEDGTMSLWDIATGKEKVTVKAHLDAVLSLAFSPDGKTLASGSEGKAKEETVKLWDVTTGKPRTMLDMATGKE